MRDLLVITNNPKRASYRQRIEIYLDSLQANGVDYQVEILPSHILERRKLFGRAKDFRVVFLHKKCLNFFDAHYLRRCSKKIIYDFDDAIMYSPNNPASDRGSHFRRFSRMVGLSDVVIAGNSCLAEYATRFNSNVRVLPTGLNTQLYSVKAETQQDDTVRLVWIGAKSTLQYLKQIKPAIEEIGKRYGNVVLKIICDDFFELDNMKAEKCRWSLQSQYFDLASSEIGLGPLPDNRFTRGKCGFKILQYQAAGLPVVASAVGVNSQLVRDTINGYHAQNITEWVDKISLLIENPDLRKQMGQAGKIQVKGFDSHIIGKKLCTLITNCIEKYVCSYDVKPAHRTTTSTPGTCKSKVPIVSICIPTYNRKKYLKETIDSILAQTYKDYEIVIVDDGSTDGTKDMIKQLGIPVIYHWQDNSGDAATRNRLVKLSGGKYISFIDSDDLLLPDAIERMIRVMDTETEDIIVYGSYYRIDQNGKIYGRCKRKLYSGNVTKYLFQTIFVHSCGSMFPKRILKDFPVFDTSLKVCSDYDMWLRLSAKYRFVALPEPTFKRRRHSGNLSGASFENCFTELQVLRHFYYEDVGKELVPERIAMKVFSKESRRTGRCAVREGLYDRACQLLGESFHQYPNLKSLMSLTRAKFVRQLAQLHSALKKQMN